MRTRVKICGITRLDDALAAAEAGADAVGFVFWPRSPRCVPVDVAARIRRALPAFVVPVGVFVNQGIDQVAAIADTVGLGAVQLHGDEPPAQWAAVPAPCIKAVAVSDGFDPRVLAAWPEAVLPLLDVYDPERRGGTGRAVDRSAAAEAARIRPVVLAGGLRAENVEAAILDIRPYAVDVSSGVERAPGVKDLGRLRAFLQAVCRADARKES